ncbi:hypothetical protein FOL47_001688 [Perkinsus chesapeaki]|uniref:Uncharacterized protein n=1 Tax=Perkinsus chesapeaki TaxID=330153 RepID=A0A7J6MHP6_PERCH|nr:hypothetical protein FOL47_001688 [Perkinsus chesapeaki]
MILSINDEAIDSPIAIRTTSEGTAIVFQISSLLTWLLRILIPIVVTALYLKFTNHGRVDDRRRRDVPQGDYLNVTTVSPAQPRPFGSPTRRKIIPPTASSRCSSRASPVTRGVYPATSKPARQEANQSLAASKDERRNDKVLGKEDMLKGVGEVTKCPVELEGLGISSQAEVASRDVTSKSDASGSTPPPGFEPAKETPVDGNEMSFTTKNENARRALETAIEQFPTEAANVCQEVLQSLTMEGVVIEPQTYEAMIRAAEVSGDSELAGVLFNGVSMLVGGDSRKGDEQQPARGKDDESSTIKSDGKSEEAAAACRGPVVGSQSPPGLSTAAATPLTLVPQQEGKNQTPPQMQLNAKAPEFVPSGGYGTAPTTRFLDSLMDHRRAVAAARYYQNQFAAARYMGGLAAMAKAQMQAVQLAQAQGSYIGRNYPSAPGMPTIEGDTLGDWAAARAEEEAQVQMRVKKMLEEKNERSQKDPSMKVIADSSRVGGDKMNNKDVKCSKNTTDGSERIPVKISVDELKQADAQRRKELLGI